VRRIEVHKDKTFYLAERERDCPKSEIFSNKKGTIIPTWVNGHSANLGPL